MNMKLVDAVLACRESEFECVALPLGDVVDPRVIIAVREDRGPYRAPVDHFAFTAEPRLRISEAKAFHENLALAKRAREDFRIERARERIQRTVRAIFQE